MRPIEIVRTTGEEPLRFNGTRLWWDPRTEYGPRHDWVETQLFLTEDDQYVLWLAFRSDFGSREDDWHAAWLLPDEDAVLETLWDEHPRAEEVVLGIADLLNAYEDLGQVEENPAILLRSWRRPLRFNGRLVASYDGNPPQPSDWEEARGRWDEARVYETADGRYVLALGHNVPYATEDERSRYDARVLGSLEEALEALKKEAPRAAKVLSRQLEGVA